MNPSLKTKIDHCYILAENGATDFAYAGLKSIVTIFNNELLDHPLKPDYKNLEEVLQNIERTSHRIGIDVAFEYAEHFYQEGDKSAAREWLRYAKMHAKSLKMDITDRISAIKSNYKDRIPLLFFFV